MTKKTVLPAFFSLTIALAVVPITCATTWYVNAANGNDANTGLSWSEAKASIQAAIDIASGNDEVLVADGIYAPISTNRKGYEDTIVIRSVNGADRTIIDGDGICNCAYLRNDASDITSSSTIKGFTLRNGYLGIEYGMAEDCIISNNNNVVDREAASFARCGGAAYSSLKNCVIANNVGDFAGGAYYTSTKDCIFRNNKSDGDHYNYAGGAYGGTHSNTTFMANTGRTVGGIQSGDCIGCVFVSNTCVTGSGAVSGYGARDGCLFKYNSSSKSAGAGENGTYRSCLFAGNMSSLGVGAVVSGTLINCTVVGNTGKIVGGLKSSIAMNTIVWNNVGGNVSDCSVAHSCISPLQDGEGNIDAEPGFFDAPLGDYTLALTSPCIDAGTCNFFPLIKENFLPASKDMAGNARFRNGALDIGAYEYQIGSAHQGTTTYYVDGGVQENGDGKSWDTAFPQIQDAIDIAMSGDVIIVRPGCYRPISTNAKLLTIESEGGSTDTIIDASLLWGEGITNRCANLGFEGERGASGNTKLRGFTLVNGSAVYGGGVVAGFLDGCIISNCVATEEGGGAYASHLENCILQNNKAENGGGFSGGTLNRCCVRNNYATQNGGGGARGGTVLNSIVVHNTAEGEGGGLYLVYSFNSTIVSNMASVAGGCRNMLNCYNSIIWDNFKLDGETIENYTADDWRFRPVNCCVWPEPESNDQNTSADPCIVWNADGTYELGGRSSCIDAGMTADYVISHVGACDYFNQERWQGEAIDIGAIESASEALTAVRVNIDILGRGEADGHGLYNTGDVVVIHAKETDSVHPFEGFFVDGRQIMTDVANHGHEHRLEYLVSTSVTIVARFSPTTFYVSTNGDDGNIGTNKGKPKLTIQSAIDSAGNGDVIVVDDGVYDPIVVNAAASNIKIKSLNGSAYTVIDGQMKSRCVDANGGRLEICGFTIRNGNGNVHSWSSERYGGGIRGVFECYDSVISNCFADSGGGASRGVLYNCRIEANTAYSNGGGCYDCILYNCVIANNSVLGGVYWSGQNGGGMYGGSAYNCTVVGNFAYQEGGGVYLADLCNCIIMDNSAPSGSQVENRPLKSSLGIGWYYATNCFSSVQLYGRGNRVGDDARFTNASKGDFSLLPDSPCIDVGDNDYAYMPTDFNGNKRISNDIIDIGAIEYQQAEKVDDSFTGVWGEWSVEDELSYTIPECVTSWEALSVVAWRARDAYTRSGATTEIPPTREPIILSLGAIAVPDSIMVGDVEYETEVENGVDVWRMRILEDTNTCSLVASIGSQAFKLSNVPSYASALWTSAIYGNPPTYLTGAEAEEWYAMRSRNRIAWLVTLVPNSRWAEYCSNREVLASAAEQAGESRLVINGIKSDTNTGIHGISVRSLGDGEIRIFGSDDLSSTNWSYMGYSLQPRGTAMTGAYSDKTAQFMKAVFTETAVDSDGDGISDILESTVYGTNPNSADTSGDGIWDWEKIYRYGLNPKTRDTDHDGITDDEEILADTNPTIPASGAIQESLNMTIRYYYDDDDRLIGTYFGREKGKVRATLSPVGNPLGIEKKGE